MPPTDSPNTGSLAETQAGTQDASGRTDGAAPGSSPGFGQQMSEGGDEHTGMREEARERVRQSYEQVRHFTSDAVEKARQQLHEGTDRITERARGIVDERKSQLCRGIEDAAQAAHAAAQTLEERDEQPIARWAHMAGDNLERLSHWVEDLDVQEVAHNVRGFARRHPEIVLGGMFVAGLVVARLLKADQRFESRGRPPHGADENVWRDVYESQLEGERDWEDGGMWGARQDEYRFGEPGRSSEVAGYNPSGGAGAGYPRSPASGASTNTGASAGGIGESTTARSGAIGGRDDMGLERDDSDVGPQGAPGAQNTGEYCPPGTERRSDRSPQQRGDWQ